VPTNPTPNKNSGYALGLMHNPKPRGPGVSLFVQYLIQKPVQHGWSYQQLGCCLHSFLC